LRVITVGREQNFLIVGINQEVFREFASWFTRRGLPEPVQSNDGVFVSNHEGTLLLAGVCIYPTDGPYAVVEKASTNPDPKIPRRVTYAAMIAGARALRIYGAMRKKLMLCYPDHKGLELVLRKAGFEYSASKMMAGKPYGEWR
jgi:hypothetical protein